MSKTDIQDLQKKLSHKQNFVLVLKKRVSRHKKEVLESEKQKEMLVTQYESVIEEQRKLIKDLIKNAPKLFYLHLNQKFYAWKEGRR